jgi:hypothetical protein
MLAEVESDRRYGLADVSPWLSSWRHRNHPELRAVIVGQRDAIALADYAFGMLLMPVPHPGS